MDPSYEYKSTGVLVDEMITAEFKIEAGNEDAKERRHKLGNIVMGRMAPLVEDMNKHREFQAIIKELRAVLRECWDAQETVRKYTKQYEEYSLLPNEEWELAGAGITAQKTNAQRNKLIRRLEELLGEQPQLEKTYG